MKIAIDLDKTLFNCKSVIYEIMAVADRLMPVRNTKPKIFTKEDKDYLPSKYRKLFGKIGDPELYEEIDGSVEMVNKLAAKGHTVCFLSSRPNMRTMNHVVLNWLEKHKVNYDFVVVNCSDKAKFCEQHGISVLIDDSMKNCKHANEAGINSILLDTKQKYDLTKEKYARRKGFYSAKSWEEVGQTIKKIEKEEKSSTAELDENQETMGL